MRSPALRTDPSVPAVDTCRAGGPLLSPCVNFQKCTGLLCHQVALGPGQWLTYFRETISWGLSGTFPVLTLKVSSPRKPLSVGDSGQWAPCPTSTSAYLWFIYLFFAFEFTPSENALKAARYLQLKDHFSKDKNKSKRLSCCLKLPKRNQFRHLCLFS